MVYFKDGRYCARFVRNRYQYYFGRYRSENSAWEVVNKALAIYAEGGHDAVMKFRQTLDLAITKVYDTSELETKPELTGTDIVLSYFKGGGYKSLRTLVNETCLEASIVEEALKVLLENNEIAIENPNNSVNKLYYLKPKTKWRQKKL
mgnify:FL=1